MVGLSKPASVSLPERKIIIIQLRFAVSHSNAIFSELNLVFHVHLSYHSKTHGHRGVLPEFKYFTIGWSYRRPDELLNEETCNREST